MLFKSMPLDSTFWRKFEGHPTVIYSTVYREGGYNFRDVASLMELSRVFPLGLSQLRFCPVIVSTYIQTKKWERKKEGSL